MKTIKIFLLLLPFIGMSQTRWDEVPSNQVSVMIGENAVELSATYTHTLIGGFAIQVVDSKVSERRANKNDHGTNHDFTTKYTPAVFGLIGGEFEEFSMIGKMGCAYVDQNINKKPDDKKLFFAVGIIFDYKVFENVGVRASYDNVAGAMIGTTLHF